MGAFFNHFQSRLVSVHDQSLFQCVDMSEDRVDQRFGLFDVGVIAVKQIAGLADLCTQQVGLQSACDRHRG